MNHVAADIAGAAGDQDRHAVGWLLDGPSSLREALRIQDSTLNDGLRSQPFTQFLF
jgi:hypothetical protein